MSKYRVMDGGGGLWSEAALRQLGESDFDIGAEDEEILGEAESLLASRISELQDYMGMMDGYVRDGFGSLEAMRKSGSLQGMSTRNEKALIKRINSAIDAARSFQNGMAGLKMTANRLRVGRDV